MWKPHNPHERLFRHGVGILLTQAIQIVRLGTIRSGNRFDLLNKFRRKFSPISGCNNHAIMQCKDIRIMMGTHNPDLLLSSSDRILHEQEDPRQTHRRARRCALIRNAALSCPRNVSDSPTGSETAEMSAASSIVATRINITKSRRFLVDVCLSTLMLQSILRKFRRAGSRPEQTPKMSCFMHFDASISGASC